MNITIDSTCNPPEKPGETLFNPSKICEEVKIFPDRVEVIWRVKSDWVYLCNPPRPGPDTVYKDVYKIDFKYTGPSTPVTLFLKHSHRVNGRVHPQVVTPERITFDDDEKASAP